MGIRKMPFDEWIEPDDQLATYHRIRIQRVAERKEQVVQVLPDRPGVVKGGAEAGAFPPLRSSLLPVLSCLHC